MYSAWCVRFFRNKKRCLKVNTMLKDFKFKLIIKIQYFHVKVCTFVYNNKVSKKYNFFSQKADKKLSF